MGRQHKAAVAALDLDPLPMTWAQRIAWHLPDDEPEPVLCAAWQTIARWLKRPEPAGNAAKLYVKRVIRKLIELGVLARTSAVRAGRGRRAEYALRVSRNVDAFGGHFGGHDQPSTPDGLTPKNASDDPQHTMYLDLGTDSEVPTGQPSLPGDWKRLCLDGEKAPTTVGCQPPNTARSSTISSSRSTRRPMRSPHVGHDASRKRPEESPVGKKTKQPTLFDVPAPVVAAAQAGDAAAHTIVGEWLSRCQVRPQSRIIGQVGKLIKEALAEGIDADSVRAGTAVWMRSGRPPVALVAMIHEQQTLRHPPAPDDAGVRRTGRDQTVAEWLDFSARLEAAEAAGPQWAVGA